MSGRLRAVLQERELSVGSLHMLDFSCGELCGETPWVFMLHCQGELSLQVELRLLRVRQWWVIWLNPMWSQESFTMKDRGRKRKSGKAVRAEARSGWEHNSVPSLDVRMAERARSQGMWATSKSWQRKGNRLSRTARMKHRPPDTCVLVQWDLWCTPDLWNCEIINWCDLKPLTCVAVCYSRNRKLMKKYNVKRVNSWRKIIKGPDTSEKEVRGYTGTSRGRQASANLN